MAGPIFVVDASNSALLRSRGRVTGGAVFACHNGPNIVVILSLLS